MNLLNSSYMIMATMLQDTAMISIILKKNLLFVLVLLMRMRKRMHAQIEDWFCLENEWGENVENWGV